MAAVRPKRKVEPTAQTDVTVPPELAVGSCTEIWSETGHEHDLGTATRLYTVARFAWEEANHLDTATSCALIPVCGPYSVTTAPQRLAEHGFSPEDVPWLRIAAQQRVKNITDTDRRSAP